MKYVVIIICVAIIVRIDFVLHLVEKGLQRAQREPTQVLTSDDVRPPSELISMDNDQALKATPRQNFLNFLSEFIANPDRSVRERAVEVLRSQPSMFGSKLDPVLENSIFSLRDLVPQKDPELGPLLMDLISLLQGENQMMVRRFLSLVMDQDLERFLMFYHKSADTNCVIATYIADDLNDDLKLNEFYEREEQFKAFLAKEKTDPILKNYANFCLTVLQLQIQKMAPPPATQTEASPEESVTGGAPAP
jgi:hypothetical protein